MEGQLRQETYKPGEREGLDRADPWVSSLKKGRW